MIARLLEYFTGKDDVERVAATNNRTRLDKYLQRRRLFFPKKPLRFLDADDYTGQDYLMLLADEAVHQHRKSFELWVLEVDGQKRLPAFSSDKQAEAFSLELAKQTNMVFELGCVQALLPEVMQRTPIDVVDLNLFGNQSWEIEIHDNFGQRK